MNNFSPASGVEGFRVYIALVGHNTENRPSTGSG